MIEDNNYMRKIIIPFTEDTNRIRHYIGVYTKLAMMLPEIVILVLNDHHYISQPVSMYFKGNKDA